MFTFEEIDEPQAANKSPPVAQPSLREHDARSPAVSAASAPSTSTSSSFAVPASFHVSRSSIVNRQKRTLPYRGGSCESVHTP